MISTTTKSLTAACLALGLAFLGSPGNSFGQDGEQGAKPAADASPDGGEAERKKPDEPKRPRPDGGGGKRPAREGGDGDDLSKEEQERLRRMLSQVWSDPAVVQSREEVRVASENFRRVLHAKLKAIDPEAAKLMEKVSGRSRLGDMHGGGKAFGGGPGRPNRPEGGYTGLEYMARPPFYASLGEEDRKVYDAAYREAMASGALESVTEQLKALRQQDESLRQKRTQQFRQARGLLKQAMIKADPRVEKMFASGEGLERKREENGDRPAPKPKSRPE